MLAEEVATPSWGQAATKFEVRSTGALIQAEGVKATPFFNITIILIPDEEGMGSLLVGNKRNVDCINRPCKRLCSLVRDGQCFNLKSYSCRCCSYTCTFHRKIWGLAAPKQCLLIFRMILSEWIFCSIVNGLVTCALTTIQ
ncbi:hypothetical protein BsWGS_10358 [Bradybaena similaris]